MSDNPDAPQSPLSMGGVPLIGGDRPPAPVGATAAALLDPYATGDTTTTISYLQQRLSDEQVEAQTLRAQLFQLQQQTQQAQQKIAALQTAESTLRQQIQATQVRNSRMPDDFASAVGHSIDTLQARLTGLSNSLTDFALREFTIEAKVAVNVTPLGTVEYRFIQPGEQVDPTAVSNVRMTVVPVPKQSVAGSWSPVEFTPSAGVEEIRGIGKQLRQHLNQQGIYTVADLLHAGSRARGSVELAGLLQVDRYRLSEWLAHAQLLTIRNVDGRIAGVLYEIGVRTLEALAARSPEELAEAFNAQVQRTGRKRVALVDAATVTPWIRAARLYLGQQPDAPPSTTPESPPPTSPPPTSPPPPTTSPPPPPASEPTSPPPPPTTSEPAPTSPPPPTSGTEGGTRTEPGDSGPIYSPYPPAEEA